MFRRFVAVSGVFVAMCALLSPSAVMAQSKDEGIRLFNAALALEEKAQTNTIHSFGRRLYWSGKWIDCRPIQVRRLIL